MKIIEDLCDYIDDEICDAEKYIKHALDAHEDYPEVAELFNMLSAEEIKHMQLLHGQVVKLIDAYRKLKGEPPEDMLAIYDYLHRKSIEKVKQVKILQQMYLED